ncbi:MAG TPA: hypothetical protein VE842_00365 [Pyrinomonadaceae bacterium]|jgi:hypothetical protein|nr:hypothetical protein [Pyrinomonadaceae bacterium]
MGLRLYCNRYAHFKEPLVCSVVCPFRTRCQDFALFYDAHRDEVDLQVEGYFTAQAATPPKRARTILTSAAPHAEMRALIKLEVKREMPETTYIWIGKDDQAELLNLEEIIRRAERGAKAKNIYKVAQEMELRFQLVPRKRIEKAKRTVAAEAERAAARRSSRLRPVAVEAPAPPSPLAATPAANAQAAQQPSRRARARIAKAASER